MNPLRTLLSIFPHPLHAFMSQGRIYVYVSERPHLENRQPFHDFIFGTRHFRQPLQGRRISRVPQTTVDSSEIWRSPVEGGSLSHDLYIPGGCLGFPTSMVRGSRFSPKALEEEALGGFNLLPSTGPVATWMRRCLSSRLAWSTWVWRFDSSQVRIVFRPRVLSLFLLGESKADV